MKPGYVATATRPIKRTPCRAPEVCGWPPAGRARRKFDEAKEANSRRAGIVLLLIQRPYQIGKQLREAGANATSRQLRRQQHSRMIVETIGALLRRWKHKHTFLPQSLMGRAIDYSLTLGSMLLAYLEDGRIEIDNNPVENAIRPTAVGKKNWLFIGEAAAGERSAIFFTLIEACRSRGIDPQTSFVKPSPACRH